ncbi:glycosyltransferase family 4 protein [Chloroflexi bacterium CFX5]|nr:glycosyltransferase family 4 protein [Chloroflexi bacterium CFX5]NUQ59478.1 glycosyltransferase family 4 protein [Anaerolineales bacterium]
MKFSGKLGLQQRVLPSYRVPFFDLLAGQCEGGLSLFAGQARPEEMIAGGATQLARHVEADNLHLFSGAFYLCHQRNFIRWLEDWNPDALIVEANPRYLSTPAAVKWMRERGRKVLGWGLGAPKQSGLWRRFIAQFDGMIAYSQRGAEEYASLGLERGKIFVAHNSVSARPAVRVQRSNLSGAPTLLFVGRLQARKRIDSLLRACSEMEFKPRLLIVGDGPEREALESLAKEIYPSAEFIGAKHGAELKPYFEQADLFVLPGTGGLAVQEAMSYGLPVIVAKGDGTQDDLVRDGNGWQIEPENYKALVAAMKNALSDTARLRKMGNESFRIVSEEINIEAMAEAFVRALNSI